MAVVIVDSVHGRSQLAVVFFFIVFGVLLGLAGGGGIDMWSRQ